ncbi:transport and Golgi organization protein 1 homolog isoform X1 [Centroberyx gerrardi]|uniref:transport and Golgi organization protein 1 homolog isoform X1 n=1 Tax=Centroberyx gerrardi TaxID=166262 RepID=UPI003AACFFD9
MAAKVFYRKGFLLLLFNFISTTALDKRFSDFKRCADEECSMLLCRGKAVSDFSGPDCRFLSFKKSETIYVYYKVAGRRTDLWAGSVGNRFGYFPKDLLALNHIYTEKELEIKAEETDFVCFDTGFDKFDSYDIESLLGSSVLTEENDSENTDTPDQIKTAEGTEEETKPSTDETTDSENENDGHDNSEDLDRVPDDQSASLPPSDMAAESLATEVVESDTGAAPDATETTTEDAEQEQQITGDSILENVDSEKSETKDEPASVSAGMQIPELKTTLGTTFDAVTTDDESTWKVTPYEEEESTELEYHHDDYSDNQKETPLLSFSEEAADAPEPDPLNKEESPPTTHDDDQQIVDKNMWTSLGDTVFAIVSGGETTTHVSSSEEDDDEGDEEEIASKTPPSTEDAEKEEIQLLSAESPKEPEAKELVPKDPPTSSSVEAGNEETYTESEPLLFDYDDESDGEMTRHENAQDETVVPTGEQRSHQTTEESMAAASPVLRDNRSADPQPQIVDIQTLDEPTEEEVSEDSEGQDNAYIQDYNTSQDYREDLDTTLEENKTVTHQEPIMEIEPKEDLPIEEEKSKDSEFKDHDEKTAYDNLFKKYHDHSVRNLEKDKNKHSSPELSVEGAKLSEEERDKEPSKHTGIEREEKEEELLEDENAISFTQSHTSPTDIDKPSLESSLPTPSTSEPEYSDSVLRLTLLRDHFTEEDMERFQKLLGLKNLFKVEAMFSDLDVELQAARLSHVGTTEDIEKALEGILEVSENTILDEIEKMLDSRNPKHGDVQQGDTSMLDEEAEILDDFQELAFSLRQKYSAASDSTPLSTDTASNTDQDDHELNIKKEEVLQHTVEEEEVLQHTVEEKHEDILPGSDRDDDLTVTDPVERPPEKEEEQVIVDEVQRGPDVSVEEDGGHFNKNKDNQPSFNAPEEMQKVPQATLENPFDMGLGVEMEHSSSGSLDSMEPVSDFHEEELGLFSTGMLYIVCLLAMIKTKIAEWTIVMISLLPEEWKPGETLFGFPLQTVVITALVGVFTFILFFWRTILAVKKREYLVDEKVLKHQIEAFKKEKNDAVSKMSELQKQTEELKEKQKRSEETNSCALKRNQDLESKVLQAETWNQQIAEEKNTYAKLLEEEQANSLKNETRIEKLEKSNDKLQLSRKKTQEALAKTTVLLDEAKIREDARNVQHKCLEKDHAALKEENKTLKTTIKGWEDKHKELNEQIKIYQKSQKELEDSVVLKDHNVEVLSDLLADLDACDLQKSDGKVLANGEVATDKKTAIKNRIKQMMDVSRVQTTLTVVEEERDRFMTKLLNEEKARKAMEEQHQELEHAIATLKSDKSHVENQFKILQQKNEIMTEMYQQKENALQQRLTKEELERRSKESLLSEVGGKALEAEEQVKVLRQRINEMEDQMKKTEDVYKEQIKEQENKTHSNWVNARNAERALNQEKVETSKLREKLAVLTSQLNERRAPLFRPNSGQPMGPRQGDSYGPSPVSGGAPSPPPMIEGPRRPPSAPVGRRIDPYGPRPPSDPHGRYPENKHTSGIDMMAPRTSSPANMDVSTAPVDSQTKAETQAEASTESPEPGPGSFLASPIRDSPASMVPGPPPVPGPQGPPAAPGPHDPLPPPGPHGRLPPPGPHRQARPGLGPHGHLYHPSAGMPGPHGPLPPNVPPHGPPLPANGHPGMAPPGPMGGEFGPRPSNGHAFRPRPGPGHALDPRGPPPPHFRPPPPHHFGPMPPPHGVRGPMGPRPPFPPDVRFPGPRDHAYPPAHLPPGGVPPHPHHGDAFVQAPPDALQNSVGPHTGPGQGQDLPMKQEAAPQDSVRPAMAEP